MTDRAGQSAARDGDRQAPADDLSASCNDESWSLPRSTPFIYLQLHGAARAPASDESSASSGSGDDSSVFDDARYFRQWVVPEQRSVSDSCDGGHVGAAALLFQRSVSETAASGTQPCDPSGGSVSLLVNRPSNELVCGLVGSRSVGVSRLLSFVGAHHDLAAVRSLLVSAARRAVCRRHGLDAVHWLLRHATQTDLVHTLLHQLTTALATLHHPPRRHHPHPASDQPQPQPQHARRRAPDHPRSDADHPRRATLDEHDDADDDDDAGVGAVDAVCGHALDDIVRVAGPLQTRPLRAALHDLLESVASVLATLPGASPAQRQAVRCWSLPLHAPGDDHALLQRCRVLSHVCDILATTGDDSRPPRPLTDEQRRRVVVKQLADVTGDAELTASSRAAMLSGLTDASTETFWESADDDRNRTRSITLNYSAARRRGWSGSLALVCVYVDNVRDSASKVTSVLVHAGQTADSVELVRHADVDQRHAGWINTHLPAHRAASQPITFVRVELRGPDNTLRVRQLRVLATPPAGGVGVASWSRDGAVERAACERETLGVFRLLTSRVFCSGQQPVATVSTSENHVDAEQAQLQQQMMGVLFGGGEGHVTRLSRLQRHVCAHIVACLHVETARLSAHAAANPNPTNERYCVELVGLLVSLCGWSLGRRYVAQQTGLLADLMALLHAASPRLQRLVVSLLRRALCDIAPSQLAAATAALGRSNEPADPPPDNLSRLLACSDSTTSSGGSGCSSGGGGGRSGGSGSGGCGVLAVLLGCVAKAMSVHVKRRGSGAPAETTCLADCLRRASTYSDADADSDEYWWLRVGGHGVSTDLAHSVMQLLTDMSAGQMGADWAAVAKCAVAQPLLALARMNHTSAAAAAALDRTCDERQRQCLVVGSPVVWLSLAALTVLHADHVELMTGSDAPAGGHVTAASTWCENHDDGETPASVHCADCDSSLCAECDRVLHLSRRGRQHHRQVSSTASFSFYDYKPV